MHLRPGNRQAMSPPRPTTAVSAVRSRRQRLLWSPLAVLLVALMAVGSILMWIGLPLGLIWIASALSDSARPALGPYVLILAGLPLGMLAIGRLLGALDRAHGRVTGRLDDGPRRAVWLRSMRDERVERGRRRSVLDTVMAASVLLALLAGAVWFFVLAGSPLPG
jgi:hypothetical protein